MRKASFLVATLALALGWARPAAADIVPFDPDGAGGAPQRLITSLDWAQGNSMIVETSATTGTILFQANLDQALNGSTGVYANCSVAGGCFTAVAQFSVTLSAGGSFTVNPGGTFQIWADTTPGNDLAGTGFANDPGAVLVMQGSATSGTGNFVTGLPLTPLDCYPTCAANNYPGVQTLDGVGGSKSTVTMSFVNPLYFPTLHSGSTIAFTNTSLITPYQQVDPAAQFWTGAAGVSSVGPVNGLGFNIMAQADANSSFEGPGSAVPEPASLTLLGLGLVGAAVWRRRQGKRA